MVSVVPAAAVLFALVSGALAPTFSYAAGNKEEEARTRLKVMDTSTNLEIEGVKPWYLKLDVQLYNPPSPDALPGAPSIPGEQGMVEEWWSSPTMYRIVYSFPGYKGEEGANASGRFRSAGWKPVPPQIDLARRQVVHPLPTAAETVDQILEMRRQDFGPGPFDCLIVGRPVLHDPFPAIGTFPSFCSKAGSNDLAITIDYGRVYIPRTALGKFEDKTIATAVNARLNNINAVTAKVEKLGEIAPNPSYFASPAGATEVPGGDPEPLPASLMKSQLEHKVGPVTENTRSRPSGVFIGRVVIGTDGHVVAVRPVSSNFSILFPSMHAIEQYVYKPQVKDGKPTEVLTTVSIEY